MLTPSTKGQNVHQMDKNLLVNLFVKVLIVDHYFSKHFVTISTCFLSFPFIYLIPCPLCYPPPLAP